MALYKIRDRDAMILRTKGIPKNITQPLVGKVSRDPQPLEDRSVFLVDSKGTEIRGHKGLATLYTSSDPPQDYGRKTVYGIPDLSHLRDGDIVCVETDGNIQTLFRPDSRHNSILVTERCNNNCLMCSQPPKDRDDTSYLHQIHKQLITLMPKDCKTIGITGGEPTIQNDLFIDLLLLTKQELPETELQVLTNGRAFCSTEFAYEVAALDYRKMILCVPLYADHYLLHDYIVQASGAFYQTLLGMQNLARFGQRIEVRIVLHKLTIPRIVNLAKFIYRNLSFVEHVAFMGLEHQGYAPHNIDLLWIDPYEYGPELEEAIEFLDTFGIAVSVYNLQLCILPQTLWKHARKSISDWKAVYLKECNDCGVKEHCGGFFASTEYLLINDNYNSLSATIIIPHSLSPCERGCVA